MKATALAVLAALALASCTQQPESQSCYGSYAQSYDDGGQSLDLFCVRDCTYEIGPPNFATRRTIGPWECARSEVAMPQGNAPPSSR
ncbi:MAG: hypothetical protein QM723_06985 [Myxococcaceae bacterium]